MNSTLKLEELDLDSYPFIVMRDVDIQDVKKIMNTRNEVVNIHNEESMKCGKRNVANKKRNLLHSIKMEPSSGYGTPEDLKEDDSNDIIENHTTQRKITLEQNAIQQGRRLEDTTKSNLDNMAFIDKINSLDIDLGGTCPIKSEDHIENKGKHVIIKKEDDCCDSGYSLEPFLCKDELDIKPKYYVCKENERIMFGNVSNNDLEIVDNIYVEGCDIKVEKEDGFNNSHYLLNLSLAISGKDSMDTASDVFKRTNPSTPARKINTLKKNKNHSIISCKCKCISTLRKNVRFKQGKLRTKEVKHTVMCSFRSPDKTCTICSMKFKTVSNLKRHMTTHSIVKHRCDRCEFETIHPNNLNRHQKIHTKLLAYRCELCEYKCVQGSSLERHKRSRHTREKPFQCDHCNYKCSRRDMLSSHIKIRHIR